MSAQQQGAAAVLGFDAMLWDQGPSMPWALLEEAQLWAARQLGYTKHIWEMEREALQPLLAQVLKMEADGATDFYECDANDEGSADEAGLACGEDDSKVPEWASERLGEEEVAADALDDDDATAHDNDDAARHKTWDAMSAQQQGAAAEEGPRQQRVAGPVQQLRWESFHPLGNQRRLQIWMLNWMMVMQWFSRVVQKMGPLSWPL